MKIQIVEDVPSLLEVSREKTGSIDDIDFSKIREMLRRVREKESTNLCSVILCVQ